MQQTFSTIKNKGEEKNERKNHQSNQIENNNSINTNENKVTTGGKNAAFPEWKIKRDGTWRKLKSFFWLFFDTLNVLYISELITK